MPFGEHIAALQNIEANMDSIILFFVEFMEDKIYKMQQEQLATGKLESGGAILPSYSQWRFEDRKDLGLQVSYPDLKETGRHYASFFLRFGKDYFEIDNSDEVDKIDYLKVHYNTKRGEIYGLTDPNLQMLINELRPLIIDEIRYKWLQ
jgi:hypothetical protein